MSKSQHALLASPSAAVLKILFIEDDHADYVLAYRYLVRQGLDCHCERVDRLDALARELDSGDWDLVLSDCSLPQLHVADALRMVQERRLDLPFILLSGVIGEEDAVDLLKAGAEDFVSKENLSRLVPALERALREVRQRQAKQEAERHLASLMSNLPGMAYRCRNDRLWTMEFASDGACQLLGYTPEELVANTRVAYADLIYADDRERVWTEVQAAIRVGAAFRVDYRIIHRDGSIRWVLDQGHLVTPSGEEPGALEGFVMDVSDRHRAYERLAESEERFKLAVEGASEGLWDWNQESGSIYYSPRWKSMLGFTQAEIGDTLDEWRTRVHPDDLPGAEREVQVCMEGGRDHLEVTFRLRHKSGAYVWILSRGRIVRAADGRPRRFTGVHIDVTERVMLEQALLDSVRNMQTLSRCNGAIARAATAPELLQSICDTLVRIGRYELAWAGLPDTCARGCLQEAARAGADTAVLDLQRADSGTQPGPAERALLSGELQAILSAAADPGLQAWRTRIADAGDFAVCAWPVKSGKRVVAVLCVHTREENFCPDEHRRMLGELADNLAFGLGLIRERERSRTAS